MPVYATEEQENKTFIHLMDGLNESKTNFKRKMVNQTLDSFANSKGFEKSTGLNTTKN